MTARRRGPRGACGASTRAYVLGLLVLVYTCNFVDRQILSILLEPIKRDLELSDTQLGLLTGFAFAAFYATQKSKPAEKGQTLVQELTDKCERCHGAAADSTTIVVPKLRGQDRDYLIMALRAYRDDRRESSMMHRMSLPYGDAVIESIASYYASQPAK